MSCRTGPLYVGWSLRDFCTGRVDAIFWVLPLVGMMVADQREALCL
jgi:hypothetical protein